MKKTLTLLAAVVLAASSCSTPSAPEYDPRPAYESELSRGWDKFQQNSFGLAALDFRNALELDSRRLWPEAYIGLGWSLAMQDSTNRAINHFNTALTKTPDTPSDSADVFAGLGLSYREVSPPNFVQVRSNVNSALAIDSLYVFQHRNTINSDDLRAVLAEAYFNLGQLDSAAVIADPNDTLDPESDTYATDLLTRINTLLMLSMEGG